jgi:hypothetical protein
MFNKLDWKNTLISNFIEIRPLRAEIFHMDGQTDTMNLIVAIRNFADAPNNCGLIRVFKNISLGKIQCVETRCSGTE